MCETSETSMSERSTGLAAMDSHQCSVLNCRKTVNDGVRLYEFPFDNDRLLPAWITATNRFDWYPSHRSRICNHHFCKDDYINNDEKNQLKPDAFPLFNTPNNPFDGDDIIPVMNFDIVSSSSDAQFSVVDSMNLPDCASNIELIDNATYSTVLSNTLSNETPSPDKEYIEYILLDSNTDLNEEIIVIDDDPATEMDNVLSSTAPNVEANKQLYDNECAVIWCYEGARSMFDRLFFLNFPRDKQLNDIWWKLTGRVEPFHPSSKICSIHFIDDDFVNYPFVKDGQSFIQIALKSNSIVPTRFLDEKEYTLFKRKRRRTNGDECLIKNCNTTFKKDGKQIVFFRFPFENKNLVKKWLANIGLSNFRPSENDTICSNHFESDCVVWNNNTLQLIENAVPSIKPKNPFVKNSENDFPEEDPYHLLDLNNSNENMLAENVNKKRNIDYETIVLNDLQNSCIEVQQPIESIDPITSLMNSTDSIINNENQIFDFQDNPNSSDIDFILSNILDNNDCFEETQCGQNTTNLTKEYLESCEQDVLNCTIDMNENSTSNDACEVEYVSMDILNDGTITESSINQTNDNLINELLNPKLTLETNESNLKCYPVNIQNDTADNNASSTHHVFVNVLDDGTITEIVTNETNDNLIDELHNPKLTIETNESNLKPFPVNTQNVTTDNDASSTKFTSRVQKESQNIEGQNKSHNIKAKDMVTESAKQNCKHDSMYIEISSDDDGGKILPTKINSKPKRIISSENNTENELSSDDDVVEIPLTKINRNQKCSKRIKLSEKNNANGKKMVSKAAIHKCEDNCVCPKLLSDDDGGKIPLTKLKKKQKKSNHIKLSENKTTNGKKTISKAAIHKCEDNCVCPKLLSDDDGGKIPLTKLKKKQKKSNHIKLSENKTTNGKKMVSKAAIHKCEDNCVCPKLLSNDDGGEIPLTKLKKKQKKSNHIKLSENNTENAKDMVTESAKQNCKHDSMYIEISSDDDGGKILPTKINSKPKRIISSENNTENAKEMVTKSKKPNCKRDSMCMELSSDDDIVEIPQTKINRNQKYSKRIKLSENNTANGKKTISKAAILKCEDNCVCPILKTDDDGGEIPLTKKKNKLKKSSQIKLSENNTENAKKIVTKSAKQNCKHDSTDTELSNDDIVEIPPTKINDKPENSKTIKLSENNTKNGKKMVSKAGIHRCEDNCVCPILKTDDDGGEIPLTKKKKKLKKSSQIKLSENNTENAKKKVTKSAKQNCKHDSTDTELSNDIVKIPPTKINDKPENSESIKLSENSTENVKNMVTKSLKNNQGRGISSDNEDWQNYFNDTSESLLNNQNLRECYGEMLPAYCECESECYTLIPDSQRKQIFKSFNMALNVTAQNCKIAELVTLCTDQSHSSFGDSPEYHFKVNDRLIKVCRVFFINTLGITEKRVDTILIPDIYNWYSCSNLASKDNHLKHPIVVTEPGETTDFVKESLKLLNKDYDLFLPDVDQSVSISDVPREEFEKVILFFKSIPRVITACDVPGKETKKYLEISLLADFMYKYYSESYLKKGTFPPCSLNQFKKIYNTYMKLFLRKQ